MNRRGFFGTLAALVAARKRPATTPPVIPIPGPGDTYRIFPITTGTTYVTGNWPISTNWVDVGSYRGYYDGSWSAEVRTAGGEWQVVCGVCGSSHGCPPMSGKPDPLGFSPQRLAQGEADVRAGRVVSYDAVLKGLRGKLRE